jgi:cellobiose phosphorylase
MAGVLADFDGLRIAPAAPPAWREYELKKTFRGVEYRFRFRHESGRNEVKSVEVDGRSLEPVEGEFKLPAVSGRRRRPVEVEVVM